MSKNDDKNEPKIIFLEKVPYYYLQETRRNTLSSRLMLASQVASATCNTVASAASGGGGGDFVVVDDASSAMGILLTLWKSEKTLGYKKGSIGRLRHRSRPPATEATTNKTNFQLNHQKWPSLR